MTSIAGPETAGRHTRLISRVKTAVLVGGLGVTATIAPTSSALAACKNPNALGVSRVIEIDTSDGPLLGSVQYKSESLLRDKEVVLTFDDGPNRVYTRAVVKALAEQCTKGIFFMVGRMAASDPAMVREIAKRGHVIATHTWSHKNLANLSKKRGIKQVELGISAITKALGKPIAPFFRFPYLSDPKRMIKYTQRRGLGIFSIDIDSKDYRTRSGYPVESKVLRDLKRRGKGIVLFHDIQRSTAKALPGLLRKLKTRGYKVVLMVPKAKGSTQAAYDAVIEEDAKARQLRLAETPLASRSIVFQAGDDTPGSTKKRKRKATPKVQKKPAPQTSRFSPFDGSAAD